jgi:hypothetical protein
MGDRQSTIFTITAQWIMFPTSTLAARYVSAGSIKILTNTETKSGLSDKVKQYVDLFEMLSNYTFYSHEEI